MQHLSRVRLRGELWRWTLGTTKCTDSKGASFDSEAALAAGALGGALLSIPLDAKNTAKKYTILYPTFGARASHYKGIVENEVLSEVLRGGTDGTRPEGQKDEDVDA